jgi:peptidoglycan/xylan/chitin deacetylase (PgdA/CDA1 family)
MWTVDPGDYLLGGDPDGVVRAVARADEAGPKGEGDEVVLLHDNQRQTAEALPGIIDHYEGSDRGFAGVDGAARRQVPGALVCSFSLSRARKLLESPYPIRREVRS